MTDPFDKPDQARERPVQRLTLPDYRDPDAEHDTLDEGIGVIVWLFAAVEEIVPNTTRCLDKHASIKGGL